MENLTGKQLGAYQVVAPLGEGGMAAVYKAYQPGMERYVALKILPRHYASDPEFVGRFQQEAKVLANLRHAHILPVFDYGEADGYTFIVMPYLESGDLTDVLTKAPLPLLQVRRIISQVGDALDYAHSRGLIHRDVKPSNVLLDERGNCLLSDFGITKIVESTAKFTATGGIVGTPAYMSPEQGLGHRLDNRSDIYALGIMLYEMVTGRVPYRADTPMAVVIKHINDPLCPPRQVNPALPQAVEQVILKALAKQPVHRYATAGDMMRALEASISATPPVVSVPPPSDDTLVSIPSQIVKKADSGQPGRVNWAAFSGLTLPKIFWPVFLGVAAMVVTVIGTGLVYQNWPENRAASGAIDQNQTAPENTAAPVNAAQAEKFTDKVALVSDQNTKNRDIYVLDAGEMNRMTFDPAEESEPAWSPNGSKLAFASNRAGNWDVYTLTADGTTQLTVDEADDREPAWSPDGRKLAFASNRAGNWNIYTLTADGTEQVTLDKADDREPAWSPNGRKLAFASNRAGNWDIYALTADGTEQLTLDKADDREPAWSPDGRKLAFASNRGGNWDIYLLTATGTEQMTYDQAEDRLPGWSSDGTQLLFVSNRHGRAQIFSLDGSGQVVPLDCPGGCTAPDWAP
jgi:serine/threonine-protein kinase